MNKWSTAYEPIFYTVIRISGCTITARRVTDGREITRDSSQFKLANAVIIVDEQSPRNLWPIGRVSEVFPDDSGFVRRVKVMTKKSTLERPVSKLCLLESIV